MDLWAVLPDGTGLRQLTNLDGPERWPDVSPDGRTIVFTRGTKGSRDLWQIDADGNLKRLTFDKGDDFGAAISPEGPRLVWASDRDGTVDIWMMEDDGDGFSDAHPVNLTAVPRADWDHDEVFPAWNPGGEWIAFSSNELESSDIWTMEPGRPRSARAQTHDLVLWADGMPTVGPDGVVVFVGLRGHFDRDLYSIREGTNPERITWFGDDLMAPDFSPEGDRLVAAAGHMPDDITPTDSRLVLLDSNGDRKGAVGTKDLIVATDPRWARKLVVGASVASPSPVP